MDDHKTTELGLEATVDVAGMDSFPASDPPPWAATHAGTPVEVRGPEPFHHVVQTLRQDVRWLSERLGERNDRSAPAKRNLEAAATLIEERLREVGLPVKRRRGGSIEAVARGERLASESVVLGAHYDTLAGSPGADDNASGVAALIAIGRALAHGSTDRTIRLVAFGREEPPHTGSRARGSALYAEDLERQGTTATAMISLECIGRGDLVVVGRPRRAVVRARQLIAENGCGVVVGAPRLGLLHRAVRVASHGAFLGRGVPALLVTDRTLFWAGRDGADGLDYEMLGHTAVAITRLARDLAQGKA